MYLMFVSDNRPLGLRLLNLSVQRQICQQGLEYQIKFNSITAIIVLRMAIHFNPLQVLKTLLVRNQTANAFVENRRLPVQKKKTLKVMTHILIVDMIIKFIVDKYSAQH